jgi:hypothetical protein
MAAEYNLNQFNSHKNIAIKEMWEKKSKDKTRTQDVTEFGFNNAYVSGILNLQQLRLSRYIKKCFYTCRTWSLKKWAAKPVGNQSDNTLKKGELSHTQKGEHYSSKRVSTTENVYKKIMKDQVGRIKRS